MSVFMNLDTFCHMAFIATLIQTSLYGAYTLTWELTAMLVLIGLSVFAIYSGNHRRFVYLKGSF